MLWVCRVGLPSVMVMSGVFVAGSPVTNLFLNFESPPIHPITLSPDRTTLAVCNLPDGRLELFSVVTALPAHLSSVPVGIDPVTVRFRSDAEAWVVNHISDAISVVDLPTRRVVATIPTADAPEDIVFAGRPPRAFVSCSGANLVQVFNLVTRTEVTRIPIEGERPKAMAVTPDGTRVFVAIFESGNGSTILAPPLGKGLEPAGVVDLFNGPHSGQNPPPNRGTNLFPSLAANTNLPPVGPPPRASLIVKKDVKGRWLDDNSGDWTEFVSGPSAGLSGRRPGWDLPDRDVAIIDVATLSVSDYVSGLMNICMDVALNPANGRLSIIGSDAINEVRFEPNLKGVFIRWHLAQVDLATKKKDIVDLNSHLDYATPSIPVSERSKSIADTRAIVWRSDGSRAYVTGMGSGNLIVLDANGRRIGQQPSLKLEEGAHGMALDERRSRLYVLNRFASSISVVDLIRETVLTNVTMFDPTPEGIKMGRSHFYNTHLTSGLGTAACASCHVDGRFDRLAWDLGDPLGKEIRVTRASRNFGNLIPDSFNHFHPMKGPMTTLTLQDIIGHEPLHWRADRDGIEQFNATFVALQGRDEELTSTEMQEFEDFLASMRFPPNPFRKLDNALPRALPLPGHVVLGRGNLPPGSALPPGNALRGLEIFREDSTRGCAPCHTLPTGLGTERTFVANRWITERSLGTNGEHRVALIQLPRVANLSFKIPSLRNVGEKMGAAFSRADGRAGFGFFHDGRVDTLVRFIQDGFEFTDDQETADVIAFVLSMPGGGAPETPLNDSAQPPSTPGTDVPAGVGQQITVNSTTLPTLAETMLQLATKATNRLDLIVRGALGNTPRAWVLASGRTILLADRNSETLTIEPLRALASLENPVTYTLTLSGHARRIALDRDGDSWFDRTELEFGSDPADARSLAVNTIPSIKLVPAQQAAPGELLTFTIEAIDPDLPSQNLVFALAPGAPVGASVGANDGVFSWQPSVSDIGPHSVTIIATDDGKPPLSASASFQIQVGAAARFALSAALTGNSVRLRWAGSVGTLYRVEFKNALTETTWSDLSVEIISQEGMFDALDESWTKSRERYYRVRKME